MYINKTKTFIFKNQMIDYIANYYSELGNALSDIEYDYLASIYKETPKIDEKVLVDDFKDFYIYRLKNGDWEIRRVS